MGFTWPIRRWAFAQRAVTTPTAALSIARNGEAIDPMMGVISGAGSVSQDDEISNRTGTK